jgi:hypothetical protein
MPEQAKWVVKVMRPSQIAFVTAADLFGRGNAAGNGLKLMTHLIGLRGEAALKEMDLNRVFEAMSEKVECLECQQELGGLTVGLNVIWYGWEELIAKLFNWKLMMVLGEALEIELNQGFAIATMEKWCRGRVLREADREFMDFIFVPFLKGCCESEDKKLVIQTESFLPQWENDGLESV